MTAQISLFVIVVAAFGCSSATHETTSEPVAPVPPTAQKAPAPIDPAAARTVAVSKSAEAATVSAERAPTVEAEIAPTIVGPPLPKFPFRAAPYKVLIIGDSMAATDFGRALEKKLGAHADVSVARRGKSATGLARPDFFDWMGESTRRIKRHDPDLVVVVIGGNDGQDLQPKDKKIGPRRVFWKSDKWPAAYTKRVQVFCQNMLAEHRRVLWLELPVMNRRRLEKKLTLIRAVQKEAIAGLAPRVQFVPTRRHFIGKGDQILEAVAVAGYKRPQPLRQDDGIHFTVPGSRYFADKVAPDVFRALGMEPN